MTNSIEHELTCVVCRARQPLQSPCRRCGADLELVIKALRSLEIAQQRLHEARTNQNESQRETANRYLAWLQPLRCER